MTAAPDPDPDPVGELVALAGQVQKLSRDAGAVLMRLGVAMAAISDSLAGLSDSLAAVLREHNDR